MIGNILAVVVPEGAVVAGVKVTHDFHHFTQVQAAAPLSFGLLLLELQLTPARLKTLAEFIDIPKMLLQCHRSTLTEFQYLLLFWALSEDLAHVELR